MSIKLKIRSEIKNAIYVITIPYRKLRNIILAKRYPWLIPYDGWAKDSHKKYDYSYLMWEPDEGGWSKSFFYMIYHKLSMHILQQAGIYALHVESLMLGITKKDGYCRYVRNAITIILMHCLMTKLFLMIEECLIGTSILNGMIKKNSGFITK